MHERIRAVRILLPALFIVIVFVVGGCRATAPAADVGSQAAGAPRAYIFAWPFVAPQEMMPRGGRTAGAPVQLVTQPTQAWLDLQSPGLDGQARDRAAILAMAGRYRVSFDFLETVVFDRRRPARPYRSWATEWVFVLASREDFVSLQHILVMRFAGAATHEAPMVMKHWRQDWHYEPSHVLQYRGDRTWARVPVSAAARAGAWSQTVYHVDDTPRYGGLGRWRHTPSFSRWQSAATWRPLPRREHSARDDYAVLEGVNRHTILPTGWVHTQDNLKRVRDTVDAPSAYRARELGVNRYERLAAWDLTAAVDYWRRTAPFWAAVRRRWAHHTSGDGPVRIRRECDGQPGFAVLFRRAKALGDDGPPTAAAARAAAREAVDCRITRTADGEVPAR